MRNPMSLKPTVSAIAATSDDGGYSIDNVSTGLTLTMTTINELNSFNISPSSTTNGAVCDYTFTINSESPLRSTDKITFTFPSQITPPLVPSCSDGTNVSAVTCSVTGTTLEA